MVTTFNWRTSYSLLQILYAELNEEDPDWDNSDHQSFIFGACRLIIDLAFYYKDHLYPQLLAENLGLFAPQGSALIKWIIAAFGYTFTGCMRDLDRYFDTCFPDLTTWPNLEDRDKVSDQQLFTMLVLLAQFHAILFHFYGIDLLYDYRHQICLDGGGYDSKSDGGRAYKIMSECGGFPQ